jgi:hypothetical protein
MLALTGRPFWQEESYDHLVRDRREFEKIRNYVERNPMRAGWVRDASEYLIRLLSVPSKPPPTFSIVNFFLH